MRRGAGALFFLLLLAARARAQESGDSARASPQLSIELKRDSAGAVVAPVLRARHLMSDGAFEGSLRNGFPIRFTFRLTLWRDAAIYDRNVREVTWDAVVVLDPVTNIYQLIRTTNGTIESFPDLASLDSALAKPYTIDDMVPPPHGGRFGRFFYTCDLDAESLSPSELADVERWLRGDLGRALTQTGDVDNAFSRGAKLLMIRLAGLPHRTLQCRTDKFRP
ncbi:MAG TPA: hypothetical protein VGI92_11045 [Gemmatimonadales bacterium]